VYVIRCYLFASVYVVRRHLLYVVFTPRPGISMHTMSVRFLCQMYIQVVYIADVMVVNTMFISVAGL
jgi:hypothetical protein